MRERDQLERPVDVRRFTLHALAVAVVLGGLETLRAVVAGRSAPNDFGWAEALLTNMPWWLLWAVLAPVVYRLSRELPFRRDGWFRPLIGHAAASLALSVLHLALSALGIWAAVSHAFLSLGAQVERLVLGYIVTDIVTYWAILAACLTYDSRCRLQESERRRRETELRAVRLEARMTEARLDALRMELNPHFLFNTLNTVSGLAKRGEGEAAVRTLSRLGELLRLTLGDDLEHEVTLAEEADLLDRYLEIERARFGDRLTIDVRIAPAVQNALVPTLILQPLVENAIRHGVAAVRGPCRLDVEAVATGDRLELQVRDTGRGFDHPGSPPREGIGLRNTRKRLAALYEDEAELELVSPPIGGVEARLRLPLQLEEAVRVRA